jgi:ribosome assembly protein YihI (activator of Der GTPase)
VRGLRGDELAELKRQLGADPKAEQLIEKLEQGGRINRHQRKYIDKAYARLVLGRPV